MPRWLPTTTLPLAGLLVLAGALRPAPVLRLEELVGLWLIAVELHVTLHEAGHAVAGALVGFRVYAIDTGLLHLRFRPAPRLMLQRRLPLLLAGFTRTAPLRPPTRGQQIALVLGGPLASLLTGLGALALVHDHLGLALLRRGPAFALSYAIVALASAAFALLPRKTMRVGVPSDGALLLSIIRGGTRGTTPWVSRLRVQTSLPMRPRETDVALDEALASAAVTGATDGGQELILAAVLALDGQDPTRARQPIEQACAELSRLDPGNVRDVLHLSVLYFSLVEPDPVRAAADLERLRAREDALDGFAELAEAAVARASAPERARAHLARWLEWTDEAQVPGFRRAGNEWAVERLSA